MKGSETNPRSLCPLPSTQVGQIPPGTIDIWCWIPQRYFCPWMNTKLLLLRREMMRDALFSHIADITPTLHRFIDVSSIYIRSNYKSFLFLFYSFLWIKFNFLLFTSFFLSSLAVFLWFCSFLLWYFLLFSLYIVYDEFYPCGYHEACIRPLRVVAVYFKMMTTLYS